MPHSDRQLKSRGLIFKSIHISGSHCSRCKQYYSCVHVGQVRSPRPEWDNEEVENSGTVCNTCKRNLTNSKMFKIVSRAFCLGKAFPSAAWLLSFKCEEGMRNYYLFLFSIFIFKKKRRREREIRRLAGKLPDLPVHRGVGSRLSGLGTLPLPNHCSDPEIHLDFEENPHPIIVSFFST